jgi:hypothetical protein
VSSLCASCGLTLTDDSGLCPHHHGYSGDDWAASNRLPVEQREESYYMGDVA